MSISKVSLLHSHILIMTKDSVCYVLSPEFIKKIITSFSKKKIVDCQLYRLCQGLTIKTRPNQNTLFMKIDFDKVLSRINFEGGDITSEQFVMCQDTMENSSMLFFDQSMNALRRYKLSNEEMINLGKNTQIINFDEELEKD